MSIRKYNEEGMRLTDCCGAYSTFHDSTLCCKRCWREVEFGEGDGNENSEGPFYPIKFKIKTADGSIEEIDCLTDEPIKRK